MADQLTGLLSPFLRSRRIAAVEPFLGQGMLTTPHPSIRGIHEFGGHIGLFSREAALEHQELINRHRMTQLAETSGFRIKYFRRFLSGCNQIFVLEPTN